MDLPYPSYQAVDVVVDVPFNACLVVILILTYLCVIASTRLLLLLVAVATAIILVFDTTLTTPETIKTIGLLPLGLGSVLTFMSLNPFLQSKYLRPFTIYVSVAVYANVAMMIATPPGDTLRGPAGKVTTAGLSAWVVLQGYRARWRTITLHDQGLFRFNAVSLPWILAHALYRFVLLTLPIFESGRRHRLLEVYSLVMTFALSKHFKVPFAQCFGLADTLVTPVETAWSQIATTFDLVPQDTGKRLELSGTADKCLATTTLAIAAFVWYRTYKDVSSLLRERKR